MPVRCPVGWLLTLGFAAVSALHVSALRAQTGATLPANATAKGHSPQMCRGAFSADGKLFLSADAQQSIAAWNVVNGKLQFTLPGHTAAVHALGAADNNLVVSASQDGAVLLWDLTTRKRIGELPRKAQAIQALALSSDGKYLVTGGGDSATLSKAELHVWDVPGRKHIASLPGPRRPIAVLAISNDNRLVASGDPTGHVNVWEVATQRGVSYRLLPHSATALAFSKDGKLLATGDQRGRITLWEIATWSEEGQAHGHPGGVLALQFARGGKLLTSAGADGLVKLWRLGQFEDQPPLQIGKHDGKAHDGKAHDGKAWFAGFSADGKTLVSTGADGLVRFSSMPADIDKRFPVAAPEPDLPKVVTRNRAARLAVLAAPQTDAGRAVQDLTLAKLSGKDEIILLERDQVARVLQEQKLSLAGLVDAGTAVKAGKLLGVDLLGVVGSLPGAKETLGFVVFDTATGVRLADIGFARKDADQQAHEAAAGAHVAVAKWRAGIKSLKTMCFLPARNADLPRAMDSYCQALAAVLERHLVQHPTLVTLERQRLEGVNQEKTLVDEASTRELLSSVLQVQLEVGQGKQGKGLRGTVAISDNAGNLVAKIDAHVPDQHGDLAGLLLARVQEALATAKSGAVLNRGREARRFLREAERLWEHQHFLPALQAAEAAYALRPDDASRLLLAQYLFQFAVVTAKPDVDGRHFGVNYPFEVKPELIGAALSLARRGQSLIVLGEPLDRPHHGDYWSVAENIECFHAEAKVVRCLCHGNVVPADPQVAEESRAFRMDCMRRLHERMREIVGRAPTAEQGLQQLMPAVNNQYLPRWQTAAVDSQTLMETHLEAIRFWLDCSRRVPGDQFPVQYAADFGMHTLGSVYRPFHSQTTYTKADRESSLPVLEALREHPHPIMRIYAAHYHNLQLWQLQKISLAEAVQRSSALIEDVKKWIEQPPFAPADPQRAAFYQLWDYLVWNLPPLEEWRRFGIEQSFVMADFMVRRGDVIEKNMNSAAHAMSSDKAQHERAVRLIERMRQLATARRPATENPFRSLESELTLVREQILRASPHLDKQRTPPPWDTVVALVDVRSLKNASCIMAPTVHGAHVYCFVGGHDPGNNNQPRLELMRVALDGSGSKTLAQTNVDLKDYDPKQPQYAFRGQLPYFITAVVIHGDRLYAGTLHDGIHAYPLSGGKCVRIGAKDGLPSLGVASLTALDGKLYAALDDGYLICYDPANNHCDVLASSRRTERLSPFDNARIFYAGGLMADPARRRILLSVGGQFDSTPPTTGHWEYWPDQRKFKRLLDLPSGRRSPVANGVFYVQVQNGLGKFELANDKFTLLTGACPDGIPRQEPIGLPRDFSAAFSTTSAHGSFPTKLYHRGYLWDAYSLSRKSLATGKEEFLSDPANPNWVGAFLDTIEALNANQLLASTHQAIYLLHLKEPERKTPEAKTPEAKTPEAKTPEAKREPAAVVTPQASRPDALPLQATAIGHKPPALGGVFSADGKTFFASGGDQMIHARRVSDGMLLYSLEHHRVPIMALGLIGNTHLVSGGADGGIGLWDVKERKKIGELPRHRHAIHCVAVSRSGKYVATGGGGFTGNAFTGELKLWDATRRQPVADLPGHGQIVRAVDISPDDRVLAAVDQAGELTLWEIATRKPLPALSRPRGFRSVQFSPDGKYLATGGAAGEITLWDTTTWSDEATGKAPDSIGFVYFARGGNMLVTVGLSRTGVHFWNPEQLEEQPQIQYALGNGNVWMAALSPDGKTLAAAEDGSLRFWSITAEIDKRLPIRAATPSTPVAPQKRPARVALLAADDSAAVRNLQDLAVVKLTGEAAVHMLERTEIDRILREQQLARSGLVDAQSAVKAGKVLAVDVLAVVEASAAAKSGVGLAVFDAGTGLRLTDLVFSRSDPELQAWETAAGIRAAVEKWRVGGKKLTTVCFLPVRNSDLPRSMDEFCEAVSSSLERRLLLHPGIVTLERKRLEAVSQEKDLSVEAAARELLPSVLLVEMEIARAADGPGVRALVLIRDNGGTVLHRIVHQTPDPHGAGLLGPMVDRVLAALTAVRGQGTVNLTRESRRFTRNAQVLWNHGHYRQGMQAAEAAYALKADNDARLRLAEYLSDYAQESCKPGALTSGQWGKPWQASPSAVRRALHLARRALQLIDADRSHEHKPGYLVHTDSVLHAERRFGHDLRYLRLEPADAETQQDVYDFQALCAGRHLQRIRELAERTPATAQGAAQLMSAFNVYVAGYLQPSAPDAKTMMKVQKEALGIWLDHSRRLAADDLPLEREQGFMDGAEHFAAQSLSGLYHTRNDNLKYSATDRESSLPLLDALQKHPHPVIRLYASHYQTRQLLELGRIDKEAALKRHRQDIADAQRWIDQGAFKPPDRHRAAFYHFLTHVLNEPPVVRTLKELAEEQLAVVEFSMERRDVASLLWLAAGQRALAVTEFHPRLLQLTERMRELEAKPPHRLYYNPSKFLPGDLDRTRAQLLKMSPQLAKLAKSATSGPWEKVVLLAEPKAFAPANTFMVATRHERHVFLVAGGVASPTDKSPNKQAAAKPYLQLVRASLDGAPPQALGKAFIAIKDFDAKFAAVVLPSCVTQCVIHGDHLYAGTLTDGIYAFPLAGGDAVRIGDKEGLPALDVVALSAVDNKLVAILRGGYIVVYDLAARQCDVIVSSRRAQKVSPFDNAKTLAVAHIIPDPERRRVLFPILQESLEHPNTGTWAYDLKARSFHKLLPTASFRPSSVQDGAFALEAFDWLGRFDLVHDKLTLLRGKGPGGIVPQTPSGLDPKFSAAFPGRLFHGGGTIARLYHAGYVWTGSIFAGSPLREAGTNSCNTCYGQPEEIVPSTSSKPLAPMKCC